MEKTGSSGIVMSGLKGTIYQAKMQLQKLRTYELYQMEEHLPAQRKAAKEACTDLIEVLQQIINNLDTQEPKCTV